MKTAKHIQELRIACGVDAGSLARRLGLTSESYDDLERYDDELATAVSVEQAELLAIELGVELWTLFAQNQPKAPLTGTKAAAVLVEYGSRLSRTQSELEEEVGWELGEFLIEPDRVLRSRPATFLQDLAAILGFDWLRLLPAHDAALHLPDRRS